MRARWVTAWVSSRSATIVFALSLAACASERWPGPVDDMPREIGARCLDSSPLVSACRVGVGECAARGRPACRGGTVVCLGAPTTPSLEVCGGGDEDCDGMSDEGLRCCGAEPLAPEVCDGVDNDCDGATDEDTQAIEVCNGRDDDCDRRVDEGAGVEEVCNQLDDDCDGMVDEGTERPPGCNGLDDDCDGTVDEGRPEQCNGVDDDCDGVVDEDFPSLGAECRAGEGLCVGVGHLVCGPTADVVTCSFVARTPTVGDATCDGEDDDCDGRVDEDPPCEGQPLLPRIESPAYPGEVPSEAWVRISALEYTRGLDPAHDGADPIFEDFDMPAHRVQLTRHFAIATGEVTRAQYASVTGRPAPEGACTACPATYVSWYDAAEFANRLTRMQPAALGLTECYAMEGCHADDDFGEGCPEGEATCRGAFQCDQVYWRRDCTGYRLPTEAEWEAAARAGTDGLYWWGDDGGEPLQRYENCRGLDGAALLPAAERPHNPFYLRHMLGNVSEWVFDWPERYTPPDEVPWAGPVSPIDEGEPDRRLAPARLYRGGNAEAPPRNCRASRRFADFQYTRSAWLGLRLVRTVFDDGVDQVPAME